MSDRMVVIGGDAAGMSAASQALRARPDDLDVVVFEKGEYTSYAACGLPYFVGDLIHDPDELVARSPEQHRANGIDVRTEHQVESIDTAAGHVVVRGPDGTETVEPYDHLVIGTGASPLRPPLPGVDAAGVHGIQNLVDGIRLRAQVDDE
ncbi:MAG: FAD-dependent oxidoreductase, partial [Acidimicrobiales bacterium]|nr:FAD-dependent oxidoreductase [Acidimicrobiales bacterium]